MAVEVGGVRVGAAARFWITMAVLPLGLTAAVYLLVGGSSPRRSCPVWLSPRGAPSLIALAWTQLRAQRLLVARAGLARDPLRRVVT
jgi:hypothetical protein